MIEINLPEEYDARTKEYMNRMVASLAGNEEVKAVDTAALEMFAYYFNNYVTARDALLKDGMILRDEEGTPLKAHPGVKIAHDAEVVMYKLLKEFRLTPRSREKTTKVKEVSPFDAFLNGTLETR